jgi:hypothetical protein
MLCKILKAINGHEMLRVKQVIECVSEKVKKIINSKVRCKDEIMRVLKK